MHNRLIAIISFSLSLTSAPAWAQHDEGRGANSGGGLVELREDLDAERASRIGGDEALQSAIEAEAETRTAADEALADDISAAQMDANDAQNRVGILEGNITLSDIGPCNNSEVAKSNGAGGWFCAPDVGDGTHTDTLAELACGEEGDTAMVFNGEWVCQSDLPRFVDNGDGTVTDNETGLMWEKKLSDSDPACLDQEQALRDVRCEQNEYIWTADGTGGTAPNGTLFTDFLARLNLEIALSHDATCFANHCDWRLPTLWELRTILLASFPQCGKNPCIDEQIFGPTQAFGYWSSTTHTIFPTDAWRIIFSTGLVVHASKDPTLTPSFARAVRRDR